MRSGDAWGGLLMILVGVAVVMRTIRGSLPGRILELAGSA